MALSRATGTDKDMYEPPAPNILWGLTVVRSILQMMPYRRIYLIMANSKKEINLAMISLKPILLKFRVNLSKE